MAGPHWALVKYLQNSESIEFKWSGAEIKMTAAFIKNVFQKVEKTEAELAKEKKLPAGAPGIHRH